MHHDPTFWLIARASGLTAYALLTSSVLAGLTLKSRPFRRLHPKDAVELHRALALTGLAALVLHGAALVLDTTVRVTVPALVVPGLVPDRPAGVAAGVVGAWIFVVVTASFWLRRRIGFRAWRRLHWLTYALFVAATYHGLVSGTDSGRPWGEGLYLGALGAVATATAWRALFSPAPVKPLQKGEPA